MFAGDGVDTEVEDLTRAQADSTDFNADGVDFSRRFFPRRAQLASKPLQKTVSPTAHDAIWFWIS